MTLATETLEEERPEERRKTRRTTIIMVTAALLILVAAAVVAITVSNDSASGEDVVADTQSQQVTNVQNLGLTSPGVIVNFNEDGSVTIDPPGEHTPIVTLYCFFGWIHAATGINYGSGAASGGGDFEQLQYTPVACEDGKLVQEEFEFER